MSYILSSYIHWHYTSSLTALLVHIRNTTSFIWYFFSIPKLVRTLFYPWNRLHESYKHGTGITSPQEVVSTFVVNTLMRLVGAVIRLAVAIFGVVVLVLSSIASILIFILWILLPMIAVLLAMLFVIILI